MRYITVPAPIQLVQPRTKEPFKEEPKKFLDYAYEIWLNDTKGNSKGPLKLRRWMKMVDAFDASAEPGSIIALDDEDWSVLKEVVEEPKVAYPPLLACQLDAFAQAVLEASTKDPRESKSEKPAKGHK